MAELIALLKKDQSLAAPKVGLFASAKKVGDLLRPGDLLGTLKVLERRYRVLAPPEASGLVASAPTGVEVAVGYGQLLFELKSLETLGGDPHSSSGGRVDPVDHSGELMLRAPIHGVFYRRPSPGAPNYVEVGSTVGLGQTVGLIEVMKTFNPVVFSGPGFPPSAVVTAIEASERQEVGSGDVLLVFKKV
ncbi:MAG: biotin/lipoyl-containing protein [Myxococcota bacterium]